MFLGLVIVYGYWWIILVRVGRIKAKRVRVGRIKGFIGVMYGCKGEVRGSERR